jgi:HlyD family secretion protein
MPATRPIPRLLTLTLCAVGLLGVIGVAACSRQANGDPASDAKPAAKAALTVRTATPQPADWAQSIAANGNIAAWQETVVGSEIGGLRLSEVRVNVGDVVKKGQVLALLAGDTVEAELRQARASVNEAQAAFAEAQANADRARRFQETGAMSQQQITQYLTAEQTSKARIDVAKARLHAEELRLAQTRILAPDDAVVSGRAATVGTVPQVGQELFRLILRGRLEWRAEVTAAEIGRIKPGAAATLTLVSGAKVPGRVRSIAPAIDPQTRNGLVYVDLAAGEAKAGMFARGEINLGETTGKPNQPRPQVLTLPQSAVLLRDGFAQVFRVGPDRKLTQLKVATGRRVGDRVEILSGLSAQENVVESGVGFLNDGDVVEVVGTAAPAPAVTATATAAH